jgi:hypothetical protein
MPDSTRVMSIQRCFKHPSASIVMQRDGSFTCLMCGRKLKTDSIEPPPPEGLNHTGTSV